MRIISRNLQERPVLAPECLGAVAETARSHAHHLQGVVGFAFVHEAMMSELHGRFTEDPTTTDVLSFPDELDDIAGVVPGSVDADPEPRYWGDIFICTDQALRQASTLGHPYPYELMVLALHGVLHLLGHDHTRDRGEMTRIEEALRPRCAASGACW